MSPKLTGRSEGTSHGDESLAPVSGGYYPAPESRTSNVRMSGNNVDSKWALVQVMVPDDHVSWLDACQSTSNNTDEAPQHNRSLSTATNSAGFRAFPLPDRSTGNSDEARAKEVQRQGERQASKGSIVEESSFLRSNSIAISGACSGGFECTFHELYPMYLPSAAAAQTHQPMCGPVSGTSLQPGTSSYSQQRIAQQLQLLGGSLLLQPQQVQLQLQEQHMLQQEQQGQQGQQQGQQQQQQQQQRQAFSRSDTDRQGSLISNTPPLAACDSQSAGHSIRSQHRLSTVSPSDVAPSNALLTPSSSLRDRAPISEDALARSNTGVQNAREEMIEEGEEEEVMEVLAVPAVAGIPSSPILEAAKQEKGEKKSVWSSVKRLLACGAPKGDNLAAGSGRSRSRSSEADRSENAGGRRVVQQSMDHMTTWEQQFWTMRSMELYNQKLAVGSPGSPFPNVPCPNAGLTMAPPDRMNTILEASMSAQGWTFDAIKADLECGGRLLSLMCFAMLKRAGVVEQFDIDAPKLARYLCHIQDGYLHNPYHCSTHAVAVLQMLHMIATHGGVLKWVMPPSNQMHPSDIMLNVSLTDSQESFSEAGNAREISSAISKLMLLVMYLSAACHDYGHTGVNNQYLIRTEDPLAMLYNDVSPLENHHVSASLSLMKHPDCNFMARASDKVRRILRTSMIDLVLATDMKHHFSIMGQFLNLDNGHYYHDVPLSGRSSIRSVTHSPAMIGIQGSGSLPLQLNNRLAQSKPPGISYPHVARFRTRSMRSSTTPTLSLASPDVTGQGLDTRASPDVTGQGFASRASPDVTGQGFGRRASPDVTGQGFGRRASSGISFGRAPVGAGMGTGTGAVTIVLGCQEVKAMESREVKATESREVKAMESREVKAKSEGGTGAQLAVSWAAVNSLHKASEDPTQDQLPSMHIQSPNAPPQGLPVLGSVLSINDQTESNLSTTSWPSAAFTNSRGGITAGDAAAVRQAVVGEDISLGSPFHPFIQCPSPIDEQKGKELTVQEAALQKIMESRWSEPSGGHDGASHPQLTVEPQGGGNKVRQLTLGRMPSQYVPSRVPSQFGAVRLPSRMSINCPPTTGMSNVQRGLLDDDTRLLLMKVALKTADLGHLCSPTAIHMEWVKRLEEEFFRQGDMERAQGAPISLLMDRQKGGITSSQVGFFDAVAVPLYTHFATWFPEVAPLLDGLQRNRSIWMQKEEAARAELEKEDVFSDETKS